MIIIGIDPGLDGAVALVGPAVPLVSDCPTVMLKRRDYAPAVMAEMIHKLSWGNDATVFIEKVSAGPFMGRGNEGGSNKGAMGMLGYGKGYGIWIGIIAALKLPIHEVHPATWKKCMVGGMPKGKDSSRFRAMQLWPALEPVLNLKKHDGRAEALLIAEYGRQMLEGVARL